MIGKLFFLLLLNNVVSQMTFPLKKEATNTPKYPNYKSASFFPGITSREKKQEKPLMSSISFGQLKKAMVTWYCAKPENSYTPPCKLKMLAKSMKYKTEDSAFSDLEQQATMDKYIAMNGFITMYKKFCSPESNGKTFYNEVCSNSLLKMKYNAN